MYYKHFYSFPFRTYGICLFLTALLPLPPPALSSVAAPVVVCRLPARELPVAIWTLNEKDIDFADLSKEQVCNHFEGITALTTKRGFCDLLRDVHWAGEDCAELAPRC